MKYTMLLKKLKKKKKKKKRFKTLFDKKNNNLYTVSWKKSKLMRIIVITSNSVIQT